MEQGQAPSTEAPAPPVAPSEPPKRTLKDFSRNFLATLDAEENPQAVPDEPQEAPQEAQEEAPTEAVEAEAEEPQEDNSPPPVETEEVDIDGKLYAVPKELKDGYLRQADYTRKTQEVAQQRKVVEHLLGQAQQAVQAAQQFGDVLGQIKQADAAIESFHRLDWQSLRDSDPVEYATKQADFTRWQMHRQQLAQGLQQAHQQVSYAQAQQLQAQIQQAMPVLQEKIPGWGEAKAREIRAHAQHYGFTDADLDNLYDPRAVLVLHDAMEYRKLQAKKVEAVKKVSTLPPVAKPSARPLNDAKAAFQKSREQFREGGGKDLNQLSGLLRQRLRGK